VFPEGVRVGIRAGDVLLLQAEADAELSVREGADLAPLSRRACACGAIRTGRSGASPAILEHRVIRDRLAMPRNVSGSTSMADDLPRRGEPPVRATSRH
jgi:hypothetical protein